jgi:copper chaperone NosL
MNGEKVNSMYSSISIFLGGLPRSLSGHRAIRSKPRPAALTIVAWLSTAIPGRSALQKIGSSLPILSISIFFLFISCSTEPEPLVYGTDVCHFCKMTLMDKKFGAELVTKKGKVYKFDDMNCFLKFYNSGFENTEEYHHKLVVDFASEGKLIDATHAFYIKSSAIRSPMDGQVAAFESKANSDRYKNEWKGIYLAWGEVITQYK